MIQCCWVTQWLLRHPETAAHFLPNRQRREQLGAADGLVPALETQSGLEYHWGDGSGHVRVLAKPDTKNGSEAR